MLYPCSLGLMTFCIYCFIMIYKCKFAVIMKTRGQKEYNQQKEKFNIKERTGINVITSETFRVACSNPRNKEQISSTIVILYQI